MWTFVISEEMRQRGLAGNDLLVYAVIHGYSQGEQGCYYGSRKHLCELTGVAERTLKDCLKRLLTKGHIKQLVVELEGRRILAYSVVLASAESAQQRAESAQVSAESAPGQGQNLPTDNKDINIYTRERETRTRESKNSFTAPSVAEVRAYCEAKNYPIDPEEFVAHYESNGWMVGKVPMKNWKSAITSWAKRRANEPQYTPVQPRRRESAFERALKTGDAMFGTDWHRQAYGPGNPFDNQQPTPDEQ